MEMYTESEFGVDQYWEMPEADFDQVSIGSNSEMYDDNQDDFDHPIRFERWPVTGDDRGGTDFGVFPDDYVNFGEQFDGGHWGSPIHFERRSNIENRGRFIFEQTEPEYAYDGDGRTRRTVRTGFDNENQAEYEVFQDYPVEFCDPKDYPDNPYLQNMTEFTGGGSCFDSRSKSQRVTPLQFQATNRRETRSEERWLSYGVPAVALSTGQQPPVAEQWTNFGAPGADSKREILGEALNQFTRERPRVWLERNYPLSPEYEFVEVWTAPGLEEFDEAIQAKPPQTEQIDEINELQTHLETVVLDVGVEEADELNSATVFEGNSSLNISVKLETMKEDMLEYENGINLIEIKDEYECVNMNNEVFGTLSCVDDFVKHEIHVHDKIRMENYFNDNVIAKEHDSVHNILEISAGKNGFIKVVNKSKFFGVEIVSGIDLLKPSLNINYETEQFAIGGCFCFSNFGTMVEEPKLCEEIGNLKNKDEKIVSSFQCFDPGILVNFLRCFNGGFSSEMRRTSESCSGKIIDSNSFWNAARVFKGSCDLKCFFKIMRNDLNFEERIQERSGANCLTMIIYDVKVLRKICSELGSFYWIWQVYPWFSQGVKMCPKFWEEIVSTFEGGGEDILLILVLSATKDMLHLVIILITSFAI